MKKLVLSWIISLILIIKCCTVYGSYLEFDGWVNLEIHHALDKNNPDKFTLRGNMTITSLSTGTVNLYQESLSALERNQLKELAEENKLYRLQATVLEVDGSKTKYLTSSRACVLVKSQLTDTLTVSLDHTGSIVGVIQTIGNGNFAGCNLLKEQDIDDEFNTEVFIKHMEIAPIPDTASFIQKMEREREARERGEVKDTRGFFAKYWMYIVPVVILVLISGATNPDNGGR